jgi:hypothetical protein
MPARVSAWSNSAALRGGSSAADLGAAISEAFATFMHFEFAAPERATLSPLASIHRRANATFAAGLVDDHTGQLSSANTKKSIAASSYRGTKDCGEATNDQKHRLAHKRSLLTSAANRSDRLLRP